MQQTKYENSLSVWQIAHNKHFLLRTQCFQFSSMLCYFIYRYWKIVSTLLLYTFHIRPLLQTTLNICCQKIENLFNWMDSLWLKVENIVAKGEIARFEQFLLLSLCFQNAVCCRGVRKRLYEGKGLIPYESQDLSPRDQFSWSSVPR